MDIVLVILAFVLLLVGLAGSVIPMIPVPPLSYVGLLLIQWSRFGDFSPAFLWVWAAITVIVTIGDYFLPSLMARTFGGSRWAATGALIGLVAGMFIFPPFGLIFGPFLGAFIGEIRYNRKQNRMNQNAQNGNEFKVAFGAFLAFMFGTGAKLIVSLLMLYYAIKTML